MTSLISRVEMNKKPSITVITGHLGSGKTTLIQKILKTFKDSKFLVIENEFGEIGIDGDILSQDDNALVELNAGCVCCNIQSDLELILEKFIEEEHDYEHIIIEATGVANPAKIVKQFVGMTYLGRHFQLNSVVCVIDTQHYKKHQALPEFEMQVLTSDRFFLSKLDSNEESIQNTICDDLRINYRKIVYENDIKNWFKEKSFFNLDENISQKGGHSHYQKLAFEFDGEFDPHTFERYLNVLYLQYMGKIFRTKGLVYFRKNPHPYVLQGVFDSLSFDEFEDAKEKSRVNQIVLIVMAILQRRKDYFLLE